MAQSLENITTPDQLVAVMIRKGGRYAMSAFAKKAGISLVTLSHNVHQRRRQEEILQALANDLGCIVYGILPEGGTGEENTDDGH